HFLFLVPLPPGPPLFPYTTLFRSHARCGSRRHAAAGRLAHTVGGRAVAGGKTRLAERPAGAGPALLRMDAMPIIATAEERRAPRSEEHTSELQSRENSVGRPRLAT